MINKKNSFKRQVSIFTKNSSGKLSILKMKIWLKSFKVKLKKNFDNKQNQNSLSRFK